jgi:hypothetical protein
MDDIDKTQEVNLEEAAAAPQENQKKSAPGGKLLLVALILFLVFAGIQGWGAMVYHQGVAQLEPEITKFEDDFEQMLQRTDLPLKQLLQEIKSLDQRAGVLAKKNEALQKKCWFVLPFLCTGETDRIASWQNKLQELQAPSAELMLCIQRLEQSDREAISIIENMTYTDITEKLNKLNQENNSLKTEITKIVFPEELKTHQQTFIDALTEREHILTSAKDFVQAGMMAESNRELALEAYGYPQSAKYARDAIEFIQQADTHIEIVEQHLQNYLELQEKITGTTIEL